MRIEFLTKPDCNNSTVMHGRLLTLLDPMEYAVVDLLELPPDDPRRGYDTPTLLLDGEDPFGAVPRTDLNVGPT